MSPDRAAELRHVRDAAAALLGAAAMLAALLFAQWLDADALRRERALLVERARAAAARAGYQEGLDRIRCRGGWRIDAVTGQPLDLERLQ